MQVMPRRPSRGFRPSAAEASKGHKQAQLYRQQIESACSGDQIGSAGGGIQNTGRVR